MVRGIAVVLFVLWPQRLYLGSCQPPKQHHKVQQGVWRGMGVLNIHDDYKEFYKHLPRPAPVWALHIPVLMDGEDPGDGEKEGKVRSSRDEEEPHPPCSFPRPPPWHGLRTIKRGFLHEPFRELLHNVAQESWLQDLTRSWKTWNVLSISTRNGGLIDCIFNLFGQRILIFQSISQDWGFEQCSSGNPRIGNQIGTKKARDKRVGWWINTNN